MARTKEAIECDMEHAMRMSEHAKSSGWPLLAAWWASKVDTLDDERAALRAAAVSCWQPIETAPRNGTFILLAGPSGYRTTPLRVEVCSYEPDYRPHNPWQTHSRDAFTDGGEEPTHWMPLPEMPR